MSTKDLFEESAAPSLGASIMRLFGRRPPVVSEPTTFQKALAIHIATTTRSAGRNYSRD
ncbi:MAG: hypothetical protein GKS02_11160 [Alphaproteobacteria bacterium]|nr:hypothetical protein [Alphaproteobacteria bacterium]